MGDRCSRRSSRRGERRRSSRIRSPTSAASAIRSCWIARCVPTTGFRTDTIFIENEQIEPLSNRPPWLGAICESGMPGDRTRLLSAEGLDHTENILEHVLDVGANYWSLWNFHNISAESLRAVYEARPEFLDRAAAAYRLPHPSVLDLELRERRTPRPRDRPRQRWRGLCAWNGAPHGIQRRRTVNGQRMSGSWIPDDSWRPPGDASPSKGHGLERASPEGGARSEGTALPDHVGVSPGAQSRTAR